MKKLVTAFTFIALASAPVLACPGMDHSDAPKTAEKKEAPAPAAQKKDAKDAPKPTDTAKAKPAPTKDAPKKG